VAGALGSMTSRAYRGDHHQQHGEQQDDGTEHALAVDWVRLAA